MSIYRITFVLQQGIFGASETYLSSDDGAKIVADNLSLLIEKRNILLYRNVNWVGVRIAKYSAPGTNQRRRSKFFPPGIYGTAADGFAIKVPATGARDAESGSDAPDQSRSCMHMRLGFDADRSSLRYLAFIPDAIIENEPATLRLDRVPGWKGDFNLFVKTLVNGGWQVAARKKGGAWDPQPIVDWTQATAAPTNLGIALGVGFTLTVPANQMIHVTNVTRKGTDKLSYNGKYFVQAINTTQLPGQVIYYLRGTQTGDPASVKRLGMVAPVEYTTYPIELVTALRGGIHKRGKPAGTPAGKRKTRVSLDP